MDGERFERLVLIMERLAGGDEAAVFTLYGEFGGAIAAAVRRHLHHLGVPVVDAAEVDGLVMDAAFAIADCASAWRADGGALPWVWADRRIGALVSSAVGQHADELTAELLDAEAVARGTAEGAEPEELALLATLAAGNTSCRLLLAALEEVTTPRNGAVVLGYKLQASLGDRSPANTIGEQYGMQPATVRQIVKRTLDRLRLLVEREPRFSPLRDMALLA